MTSQEKRALQYIKNTGGFPRIDWFDNDFSPIGQTLRKQLLAKKFIIINEQESTIQLTNIGKEREAE